MMDESRVLRIETESDIERLRQMALLLQRENARLFARLEALTRELSRARGDDVTNLQLQIALLHQEIAAKNHALFGRSSEKRNGSSSNGESQKGSSPSEPRPGHGPRSQPSLPIVETVHTLDEADKTCPKCGGDLQEWKGQFEDSEEIDVVERSFRIVRHRRQKYRCGCGECIDTALGPPKLIPGGRYSVDFAVDVAVGKYADHLPLARQVKQMSRDGLEVTTQTLWDQIHALSRHLTPTYAALHDHVLASPVIGADETTWRLMDEKHGRGKLWWAWSVTCPDAVFYRIDASRSAEAAGKILKDFRGIVVADGYSAYGALRKSSAAADGTPRFELAACWAHARRKFCDAEPDHAQASDVVELIGKLYEIEARAREAVDGDPTAVRAGLRRTESAAVAQEIRAWCHAQTVLPRSTIGKAIGYTLELWAGLTRFLGDAAIPIDNNQTERALRGVAVGRKNHYGSRSLRGTEVAALFYSLMETAKLSGVEPRRYLAEATRRAIANPGTVTLPRDILSAP
jgi:transposase